MRVLIIFSILLLAVSAKAEDKVFVYDSHSKRDPLATLVSDTGTVLNAGTEYVLEELNVEGIFVDTSGNYAIVNGMIVKANDRLGQFLVNKIEPNRILLLNGQQTFELRLKKEE